MADERWEGRESDIAMLLHGLNKSQYTDLFEQQNINLEIFLTLTFDDLKAIGVENKSDCESLVEGIKKFRNRSKYYVLEELDLTLSQEDALTLCKHTLKQLSLLHATLANTRLGFKKDSARNKLVNKLTTANVISVVCKEAKTQSDILFKRIKTLHPNLKTSDRSFLNRKNLKIFSAVFSLSAVAVIIISVHRNSKN